jgi:hypothetical protein
MTAEGIVGWALFVKVLSLGRICENAEIRKQP